MNTKRWRIQKGNLGTIAATCMNNFILIIWDTWDNDKLYSIRLDFLMAMTGASPIPPNFSRLIPNGSRSRNPNFS